jgi:hypothetical protein
MKAKIRIIGGLGLVKPTGNASKPYESVEKDGRAVFWVTAKPDDFDSALAVYYGVPLFESESPPSTKHCQIRSTGPASGNFLQNEASATNLDQLGRGNVVARR